MHALGGVVMIMALPKRSLIFTFSKILALSSVVLLAGCVKPTKFPRYLTVADVVNNVKCQLYKAISNSTKQKSSFKGQHDHWIYGWVASFEIILEVLREANLSGDTSTIIPYTLGTFTIGASAGLRRNSKARLSFTFDANKNLKNFMDTNPCKKHPGFYRKRNLAGETGLSLWFGKLIEGMGSVDIKPSGFIYSVTFVLAADGSILPSYRFTWPSRRALFGKITGKKSRLDTNSLKVTFAPIKTVTPYEKTKDGAVKIESLTVLNEIKEILKNGSGGPPLISSQGKKDLFEDTRGKAEISTESILSTVRGRAKINEETRRQLDNQLTRDAIRDINVR